MTKRVLALDIGSVRIGAAISDPSRIIAQGLGVWQSENNLWLENLDEAVKKFDPEIIILGLPVRTDGKESETGKKILELLEILQAKYPERKILTHDERFTTVIAQRTMIEADISRKKRRGKVDQVAAVLILESWLEKQRNS